MTNLRDSGKLTEAHLRRARESAGSPLLASFRNHLDRNELELAADVLAGFGDQREDLSQAFWEALRSAYASLELGHEAKRCHYRIEELKHGFVEARLTV